MDPLQAILQPIIESFAMDVWRMVEAAGIDEYTAAYGDAPTMNPQVGIDFDLLQKKASRFAEKYRTPFLRDLQKTDRSKLFKKLKDSLNKGETFDKFYKRLDASGMFSEARARKIFRTEVNRFNNEGALQRYKDDGVPFKMLLVHQPCKICAKVHSDGYIVKTDQAFSNGFMAPPFHPHCMCTIAPVYDLPEGYVFPGRLAEWQIKKETFVGVDGKKSQVEKIDGSDPMTSEQLAKDLRKRYFEPTVEVQKEIAWVTDENGRVIYMIKGDYTSVDPDPTLIPKNGWLTHIHPVGRQAMPETPSDIDLIGWSTLPNANKQIIITPYHTWEVGIGTADNFESIREEYMLDVQKFKTSMTDYEKTYKTTMFGKTKIKDIRIEPGFFKGTKDLRIDFEVDAKGTADDMCKWWKNTFDSDFSDLVSDGRLYADYEEVDPDPRLLIRTNKDTYPEGWHPGVDYQVALKKELEVQPERFNLTQEQLDTINEWIEIREEEEKPPWERKEKPTEEKPIGEKTKKKYVDRYTEKEIRTQENRFGDEQERRYDQEIDEYYSYDDTALKDENQWTPEELRKKVGTKEYDEIYEKVQNTTLNTRMTKESLEKVLDGGQLQSRKIRDVKRGRDIPDNNTDDYVFFYEARGCSFYGDHELVFEKKAITDNYMAEWTREDSILFKSWDNLQPHILTTEQYDKYSTLIRMKKGSVWSKMQGVLGEARVMNSVDVNKDTLKMLKIEANSYYVKSNGELKKPGIREYEKEAAALLEKYPWLKGKIYITWTPWGSVEEKMMLIG